MAGKTVAQAQTDSADMNMTPMIDCVFQLIIFFMVVTEIKKSDDVEVQLPRTRCCDIDIAPKNRVVINCTAAASAPGLGAAAGPVGGTAGDHIEIRNRRYDGPTLEQTLQRLDRENRAQERRPPRGAQATGADAISNLYVKIRADARCEWRTVQNVQLACQNTGIYRLSYGAAPATKTQ